MRTFVLPNRNSVGLGAVLLATWYAGASQNNGAAFLLCFALASVSAVSAAHAWANLRGAQLRAEPIPPVFVGETLAVPVVAQGGAGQSHIAVKIEPHGGELVLFSHLAADESQRATLHLPAELRGRFENLGVRMSSVYPIGFFTAQQRVVLTQAFYVYPAPAGALPLPVALEPARDLREGTRGEGDDFAGVRQWRAGESMRHVDWKAVARGQPLMTKQWEGDSSDLFVLDWAAADGLGTEDRLRQLAQWVVLAARNGAAYGLHIPGVRIDPDRGDAHFHACLRALADFREGTDFSSDERSVEAQKPGAVLSAR